MNLSFKKPFTLDKLVRIFFFVLIFLSLFFLIKKLSNVLLPFFVAWLFAYMIHPLVLFSQKKLRLKYRPLAIIFTLFVIIITFSSLIYFISPFLIEEVKKLNIMLIDFFNKNEQINAFFAFINQAEWTNNLLHFLQSNNYDNSILISKKIFPQFWAFISSSFSFIISFFVVFIILLYVFFILLDYEKISIGSFKLIPKQYRPFAFILFDDLKDGMNRYFRSQALIAAIVGVLFAIGFKIIGLPLGILFGLFLGLLNLVPYLQTLGIIPMFFLAAIKAFEQNENFFLISFYAILVMIIIQIIQDFLLVPKIMGKSMKLNPAIILLSLSIWGSLLGILGLIIALPITTLLISYCKRYILKEKTDK